MQALQNDSVYKEKAKRETLLHCNKLQRLIPESQPPHQLGAGQVQSTPVANKTKGAKQVGAVLEVAWLGSLIIVL
jgi:hypothetical protein